MSTFFFDRIWDARAPWLLTIMVRYAMQGVSGGWISPCLQARCVIDDFGDLVAVENFR